MFSKETQAQAKYIGQKIRWPKPKPINEKLRLRPNNRLIGRPLPSQKTRALNVPLQFQSKQCFSKHFRKVSSGRLVFRSRLLIIFAAPPPIPSSVNASSAAFCATSAACCASSATFCAFSAASSAAFCASFDAASAAFWESNATFSTFSAAFCAFSAAFLGLPQLWNLKELD